MGKRGRKLLSKISPGFIKQAGPDPPDCYLLFLRKLRILRLSRNFAPPFLQKFLITKCKLSVWDSWNLADLSFPGAHSFALFILWF